MNRVLVRPSGYPTSMSLTSGSTCLHCLLVHARVAHHVGGGKVTHHKRILPTLDCINHLQEVMKVKVQRIWQFNMPCTQSTSVRNERECLAYRLANTFSAHLWLEVVGGDLGRGHHQSVLTIKRLLNPTIEEERDMSILLRFYIVGRGEEGGKGELPNLMNLFLGERALLELVVCLYWVHIFSRIPLYWCVPLLTNCHNIFPSIVDRQVTINSLPLAGTGTAALYSIWRAQLHHFVYKIPNNAQCS